MLVNAGLVPGYIVVTQLLQLGDTIWGFDYPNAFSVHLTSSWCGPSSNGPFQKPSLNPLGSMVQVKHGSSFKSACHCLYQGLQPSVFHSSGFWNDWFNALLYIKSDNLYPLQYPLMQIKTIWITSQKTVGVSGQLAGAVLHPTGNRTYGHGGCATTQSPFSIHSSNATL